MKRILASIFLVFAGFFPTSAFAAEVIRSFDVTATIEQNRRVVIEESIVYDFGDEERHGIYRYIPEVYERDGATYRFRFEVLSVERDGNTEPFSESSDNGNMSLKIGRAEYTMNGQHTYRIRYATDRAITSFADHDELYWNVTGNGWMVPIEQSSFTVALPKGTSVSAIDAICYTGSTGSKEQDCATTTSTAGMHVTASRALDAYEGLTAAISFPKGVVRELTMGDKFWIFVKDNGVLLVPILTFLFLFRLWWKRGRDPKKGTIIPQYEPPQGLSPALVGAVMTNGDVPSPTVTATILSLAQKGYLHIRFDEKDGLFGKSTSYTFVKVERMSEGLSTEERDLYNGLFSHGSEQTIEGLKDGKFYSNVASFKTRVQEKIDAMKIFDANPGATRGKYIAAGVVTWVVLSIALSMFLLGWLAAILTGVTLIVFGWFMPRRTLAGVKLLTDIEGFKWFLSVTEKDRMDFHNAPERKPEQFHELLPYAVVFGVEKKWAAQFASMNVPPPSWAEGSALSHMNSLAFASSLDSLHSSASSSAYSAPPSSGSSGFSSGGGFSGGGGGGGGGGSW